MIRTIAPLVLAIGCMKQAGQAELGTLPTADGTARGVREVEEVLPSATRMIAEDLPAGWTVVFVRAKHGWTERENTRTGRTDKRDAKLWIGLRSDAGSCLLSQASVFQDRLDAQWDALKVGGVGMYRGQETELADGGVKAEPDSLRIDVLPWRENQLERQPEANKPIHAIRIDCAVLEREAVATKTW